MSTVPKITFLRWIRSGLAALGVPTDGERRQLVLTPTLATNGNPTASDPQTFLLKGPGDVVGFDPHVVARTDPRDGENAYEPNYFPYIEFVDPDFPWRYSVDDEDVKRKPWIALIILTKDEFKYGRRLKNGNRTITLVNEAGLGTHLPNLDQSWAWAHAQVSAAVPQGTAAVDFLVQHPELQCSRLLCYRRLQPLTRYYAFVVPATKAGVKAGLDEDPAGASGPAWLQSDTTIELPTYFSFSYQTSETGDFETLVRRLQFAQAPFNVGRRDVNGSVPGFLTNAAGNEITFADDRFSLEGALLPPSPPEGSSGLFIWENVPGTDVQPLLDFLRSTGKTWVINASVATNADNRVITVSKGAESLSISLTPDTRSALVEQAGSPTIELAVEVVGDQTHIFQYRKRRPVPTNGFTSALTPALNTSLRQAPIADDSVDPLVSVPAYGRFFRKTTEIVPPDTSGQWSGSDPWIHELNLDRRGRVPASFGTTVIQVNQEEYMKECWDQVGAIREANDHLRLSGAAHQIGERLKARHIDPLPETRFALLTRPFHHYFVHAVSGEEKSLKYRLRVSGLPDGSFSSAFRRIVRRRAGLKNAKLFEPWSIAARNNSKGRRFLRWLFALLRMLVQWFIKLLSRSPRWQRLVPFLIRILQWLKVPVVNEVPRIPDDDKAFDAEFFSSVGISTTQPLPPISPLKSEIIPVIPVDIGQTLRPQLRLKEDMLGRLGGMIKVPWLPSGVVNFDPIMRAPTIDRAMYTHLSERSVDLMVPNLASLAPNTATLLEENRRFIEAYMAGLNHEMGRELVWREYPTDQRGTVFSFFWDPSTAESAPKDILPIHTWSGVLNAHADPLRQSAANGSNIVLSLKADLVRRYPEAIFFAIKKKRTADWKVGVFDEFDSNGTMEVGGVYSIINPIFSANVGADVLFVGFPFSTSTIEQDAQQDFLYYFCIMQPPSLPRFGYDTPATANAPSPPTPNDLSETRLMFEAPVDTESLQGWANPSELKAGPALDWGRDAAFNAKCAFQRPSRIVIPAAQMLGTAGGGS